MNTLLVRLALVISAALLATGCATLPSSGPTASQIERQLAKQPTPLGIHVVDIDARSQQPNAETGANYEPPHISSLDADGPVDAVHPGDVLQITIYEVGVPLFASASRLTLDSQEPAANGSSLAPVTVSGDGSIILPYIGKLKVAGLSVAEIQDRIVHGLAGKSQSPQAMVSVRENNTNTVYVSGAVRKPLRIALTPARERLMDAITDAGGPELAPPDTVVRFSRGGRAIEQRLDVLAADSPDNLRLLPGDRIELLKRPRSFTVFGAALKVSQLPFESSELSLAEALARAGGPNEAQADAGAVYLFRFEASAAGGSAARPVLYRLNMRNAVSYFEAQRFAMKDKDVLYIANAKANQPAKLVNIVNLLFAPLVLARQATGL